MLMEIKKRKCVFLEDKATGWLGIWTAASLLDVKGRKELTGWFSKIQHKYQVFKGAETPPTQAPTHKLELNLSWLLWNSNSWLGLFYLEEPTDQYRRTRLTKNERQRRITTADILALLVPNSNGSVSWSCRAVSSSTAL